MNTHSSFFKITIIKFACLLITVTYLPAQQRPNIIIIISDDQGWGDVGFNGCTDIPTPHLDALANQGVSFSAGYASHPYCSPSRAGLLTGRYQQRFGHENNTPYGHDDPEAGLPLDEKMLSETLVANGYRTCAIGKWHLGDAEKFWPNQRGFQEWYGFAGGGMSYWGDTGKKPAAQGVLRNGKTVPIEQQSYLTDDFTQEAIHYINENSTAPFFIYLAYNAPHGPIHATTEYLAKTDHIEDGTRSAYAAMVVGMDKGIGSIVTTLKEKNIFDNTLIFFYSDNGGHLNGASSQPFRGHKGMLFEGGIRVPFLVSWPKGIQKVQRYPYPISALDIYPTALAAAGIRVHQGKPLDGVNLIPFLSGNVQGKPHDILYWRYSDGAGYAIRKDHYKLVRSGYKQKTLLFNLDQDPYEQNDISASYPDIVQSLEAQYKTWDQQMIPARWYDPHPENIIKEENKRQNLRNKASSGEGKPKN